MLFELDDLEDKPHGTIVDHKSLGVRCILIVLYQASGPEVHNHYIYSESLKMLVMPKKTSVFP